MENPKELGDLMFSFDKKTKFKSPHSKEAKEAIAQAYQSGREAGMREVREQLLNLPSEFWGDEDHAVGGYISKKDLKSLLDLEGGKE